MGIEGKPFQAPITSQEEDLVMRDFMQDAVEANAGDAAERAQKLEEMRNALDHYVALRDVRLTNPVVPAGELSLEQLDSMLPVMRAEIDKKEQELVSVREELDVTSANYEKSDEEWRKGLN